MQRHKIKEHQGLLPPSVLKPRGDRTSGSCRFPCSEQLSYEYKETPAEDNSPELKDCFLTI